MTRRSLFSNRNSLSRRVLGMMASLFRRRWGATPVRRSQHGRLADRLRDWVGGTTEAAARVVNSHLLTLSQPEFLEQRAMMAVFSNVISTTDTLAVWMDADNDHAYVRQLGDGAGARLQISTDSLFRSINVYNGAVPSKLYMYDGATLGLTLNSAVNGGGSGYVTSPSVTISNTSFITPISANTTLSATTLGNLTGTGFGAVAGSITLIGFQAGQSTASANITLNYNGTGVVTGGTVNSGGANFTNLTANAITWSLAGGGALPTGATLGGALNGKVDALHGNVVGTAYYRAPLVTIASPAAGITATANLSYLNPDFSVNLTQSWSNTGITTDDQSGQLLGDLNVGQFYYAGGGQDIGGVTSSSLNRNVINGQFNSGTAVRFDSVDNVTLSAGTLGGVWVEAANNILMQGNMSAPSDNLWLSLRGSATGNINIGSTISARDIDIQAAGLGQNVTISGASTSAGATSIHGNSNISIGSTATAGTTFYAQAEGNLTVGGDLATGTSNTSWMLLQSNNGTLALDSNVSSANGTVTLSATTLSGSGLITGRSLTVQEGGGSGNYTLNANVSNLAGNTASNLTFYNSRDLNIGQGAFSLGGSANTLLLSSAGNLNVAANLVMTTGGTLLLDADKSVAITGTIQRNSSALNLTANAANGSITATSALNLGAGNALLSATTNVNIPSLLANRLNVSTVAGTINITEGDGVSVDNATVTGAGNITIATLNNDIVVEGVARIGGAGTATFQSNKGNIVLNGSAFTQSSGALVLNASNGTITNGASGTLATGSLTWIATTGAAASLLQNDTVSNYSKLTANITGAGNALQVKSGRSLTLLNITTKSGLIDVNVTNGTGSPNLAISGSVTAGNTVLNTLQNITLAAPNGAINSTGVMTGNVLTLSALNSTSLTNQNVSQLNASITGTGQNLTVSSSGSLKAGDITLSGGALNLTLSGGNLTRSGNITTGTNGSATLNVSQGSILGNGKIDSDSLNFAAIVTPDLSVANATFTRLSANITQSGNINLSRGSDLTIDQAVTSFGDIIFALSAGNLTINGPLTAGGNGNISLTASNGSLNTTANAASNITANVLTVTTKNDLVLQTDVNELIANVTGNPGNITVTEKSGLIVGSGNISAANTISITLLAGDLTRTGAINSASGNVTLNISGGGVSGNGAINAATLNWTSKSTAAINDASLTYSSVAANVTGAGNDLFISRTGDVTVLGATTASGNINIVSDISGNITTGNLAINGPITAGGGKTVSLSAVQGNITASNSSSVINTTGNVSLLARNTSSIYTNVAGLSANVTEGDLNVVEANGLALLGGAGNNVDVAGNVSIRVGNSIAGSLSGSGALNAGGDVTITAPNGAVTLTSTAGQISAVNLSITANGASAANTNVTNLTATIAAGGLTIVEADDILIAPNDVVAAGAVSITSTDGDIDGSANGGINASTGDVTLSALNGAVGFSDYANQVAGGVLTINAKNDSAVNTAVSSLVANITAGKLTVEEANNLAIGTTNATAVVTSGDLTINIANGSLTGAGSINAGASNVTLNVSGGGVTLNSSASQVRGNVLTIDSAKNAVNVNTAVNAVIANLTGEGNGIVVSQTGDLAINGGDITTENGSIAISTTGNLTRSNDIDAGTANVTLTAANGAINGSGQIRGNVLAVTAATASTLNTAVNAVTAALSTNLSSLSITEADDLDVAVAGISTNNGGVDISLTGNLAGTGSINAGTGNVTINTTAGGVNLSNGSQFVRGVVLNVTAQNETSLVTNVAELTANITGAGEGLTIREANGLTINSANVVTTDGLIDIATTTGNIDGTGVINAGSSDVLLSAVAGNINLALAANQVSGANLTIVALTASSLNTHVDDLNASISGGGLTVVDFDDLAVDLGNVVAGGAISLTAGDANTTADITGNGTIAAAAGAATVTLAAAGGKVVLNTTDGQVVGSTLTVNAKDGASVNTQVANLVANITAGGLNVTDVDSLNIGTSVTSNVIATGDISISLDTGSLAGNGSINAGAGASNVSLLLAGPGNVTLNSAANQIVGNVLNVVATSGAVNLNSAVNQVTIATNDFGAAINQSQGLTVNGIVADGNVNIALSSGDLQIDSGSILGAQLSNITLNVANGAINSVDLGATGNVGVVFGNVLDIRALNSSDITTIVRTVTANITGDAQNLTLTDADDPTDNVADGLTIGAAGVLTMGGDVTINVMTVDNGGNIATGVANLNGTGNISTLNTTNNVAGNVTLNVANGAANFTARAGQITGNVLMVSVDNTSTINTNVATLDAFDPIIDIAISGPNQVLTINELNNLEIGPGSIVATGGSDLVINVGGNLTVSASGGSLIAEQGATKGNVTLNASAGSIGSPGAELAVTANVLTINRAQNDVFINTVVDLLNANVTNGQLTIVDQDNLAIGNLSANGISLTAAGAITGSGENNASGVINSANGSGNVTLVADNISLTATNQVYGNVLNVTVVNTSSLNTRVNTLAAAITGGAGQNLTVSEADNLSINATIGDITANGGDLWLTLRSGSFTGNGGMNADGGDIYLNAAAGSIGLTGTLTANALDVRSQGNTSVTTNVSTLTANVTLGSLTVAETDGLSIGAANVVASNGVTITAGSPKINGYINGTGFVTSSGNVQLATPNGSINLTANAGQVSGGVLTLNASGNSTVNTNVSTLAANITGANNGLTVNELNTLSIGSGNVVTASGDITIITGGDLSRTGSITAGSKAPNAGADVTLNINGATNGTGVITADVLNLTAVNSSSVNTSINTLIANITRDGQSLSVFEAAGLNIAGGNVTTVNGAISVNVATGDLNVTGNLTAGAGNVTLNVLTGGINASTGNISGNVLSVVAANASRLDTAVNSVIANITGAGNTLNIVDIDSISIGTGGLKTNNAAISVTAGNAGAGTLTIANPVNAGTGNVTLINNNGAINGTANGLVSGNVLNVAVKNSSSLTTNVTTLVGNITGANQVLTINETANGLQIGAANLVASGYNAGINLTVANGSLSGSGSIITASGPITIGVTNGNLNTTGSINAVGGNLAFNVAGVVNLTANNQVTGNVLSLTANGTSALNTAITSLVANVTGAGNTLAVTDTNGLTIGSGGGGVVTNNGNITLASGKDSAGDLLVNGQVNAGNKTVSLSANGAINGAGLVTATNLTVVSVNSSVVATNVSNLAAIVSGAGKTLTVNETNGLNVANVIATNGTTINGINVSNGATAVTLNVATGSLAGTGIINAGASGNVTLIASTGSVTLNGSKQITGNVLNVTAASTSTLNTDVKTLTGLITGSGQTLTVSENAGLALGSIQTNNGNLTINTATGSFTGAAAINAGTANITLLAAAGSITLNSIAGQITGNVLTLVSQNDTAVNTNVGSLAANSVTGKLDVTEVNGLAVASTGLRANGNVNVTLTNGDLSGIGNISSTNGDVKLNAATGGINLTANPGQVSAANLLTVTAANTSQLNTNVANLTATVTNGSLTITEANSLNIAGTGVNTSLAGGNVAIALTTGNLNGAGVINAGAGNIAINAVAGSVALNQASPPPQVVGNVLTLSTKGQADVDTRINSLNASVTNATNAAANLTVREADNLTVTLASTANGTVNISTTNTSTLSVYNITARTGVNGNVTLTAGNVLVYAPGISASGTLNLSGVGNTTVVNGTIVAPTVINGTTPVNWTINSNATGPGSLNQVITNINAFNGTSAVNVTSATTVNLTSQLPRITKSFALTGNKLLTLNGTAAGASASGLTLGANGITITGVTLQNFGGAGIDMLTGATNATVSGVTVLNSTAGLRAAGVLTGSIVTNSTFDGLGRAASNGAILSGARGLKLGLNTASYNTFQNSTVGMTATGASTGTKVFGNRFIGNSRYGISLAAATGLQVGSATDLSLRNMISGGTTATIGVFASGFCTGSSVNKMSFVTFPGTRYSVAQSRNLVVVQ